MNVKFFAGVSNVLANCVVEYTYWKKREADYVCLWGICGIINILLGKLAFFGLQSSSDLQSVLPSVSFPIHHSSSG